MPSSLNFIISAPDNDAGVVAQAFDLVDGLLSDVFLKGHVARNHISAEHEFLPNHNPEFIADIVEVVGLVVTAAPLTDHIHMSVASGLQDVAMNFRSDTVGKAVERNHVRTFGKHGNTIHNELKALSPLIGNAAKFHRTQSGLRLGVRYRIAADTDRSSEMVAVLLPVSNRIPEFWYGDSQGNRDVVDASIKLQRLSSIRCLRPGPFVVRERESSGCGRLGIDFDLRRNIGQFGGNAVLVDVEVINAYGIPCFKAHRLPDTFGHESRSPIPAVVIRSFAGVRGGSNVFFGSVVVG